jgi:hypothetical protein
MLAVCPAYASDPPNTKVPKQAAGIEFSLAAAYGTTGQRNLKRATAGFNFTPTGKKKYTEPYGPFLALIRSEFRGGLSNVFMVRAKDITEATRATCNVLGSPAHELEGVDLRRSKAPTFWLVAYLGTSGSSPPEWTVESVIRRESAIRLSYVAAVADTDDIHHYFVWVPLGELKSGSYTLELFDTQKKEVSLLRRVNLDRVP